MLLRIGIAWLCMISFVSAAEPWAQWRGPRGDGHVTENPPPVTFSEKNVIWKTALPASGQSSPVVWDDRIFLTSYLDRGAERIVFAVDRHSGKLLWQQTAWKGTPEMSHQLNGWASASCATDGDRVYAFFGKGGGLFCYSRDGKLLWNNPLGDFPGPWGTAACPVLLDDLVIQNCDAEANAKLIAFDKHTGKTVWNTRREDYRGWGTPLLFKQGGRTQILVNGHTGIRSYDPKDGREIWFCSSQEGRGEPSPTPGDDGRIFVVNGLRGPMYAVKPDGKGDVSDSKRLWQSSKRTGRDLPSPGVIGDAVLVMEMKGVLTCYDANSGQKFWEERVGGNFAASPVIVNDKVLFLAEEGEVIVIDPKASPHVVARNTFGAPDTEIFRASLAAHEGQWLIRSNTTLYCVGTK
jgi:outer membrane protein assembly factor BamB